MKQLFLLAVFFIFVSCSQNTPSQLSEQEKQSIKTEIQKTTKSLTDLASNADLKLFDFFDSSAAFINDGQMLNYVDRKAGFAAANLKSQQLTAKFEDHRVLDKDNVIWIWHGDVLVTYKNDSTATVKDYIATCLFKKVGDNWKVILAHESTP
jgi:ketosteroid isomerase-like protein